ncbi:PEPTIDYL-PROLYL CIS-TRANS ISOMERASE [Ceraceosorus bombacis]|uniref:PEPTIDYL-PROLYL CIS-TRANS ISOMERASE n=1 Tax=Ceraceosorus bombacis TaxID=401625 RepID=A0A0P1BI36_9BASI|nr:PEPTIDYL-PROLYL CIS-TRANS ISOMERASE [Ceraceosorus bombacis]
MAACYLRLENGKRALEASSKALTHNANNTKASYRHALAQITLKEHYKAQAELQVLLKKSNISASEKPLIERELSDLEKFLKAKLEKERKGLKGFLGAGLGNGPAVAIDPNTTKPEEEEEEEEGQQQQRLSAKAKGKQRAQ